jgi:hypothetical protein
MAYCFSYQRFLNEKLKMINEKLVDQISLRLVVSIINVFKMKSALRQAQEPQ